MIYDIIIIGGGAGGFFSAIKAKEENPDAKIIVLEKNNKLLSKVKISGGGRCNVTHGCFEPRELVKFYPRGSRELLGPFHTFMCGDMMEWLYNRGVETHIEDDGRVFPSTNNSQTIIDCFLDTARRLGIGIKKQEGINAITKNENIWELTSTSGTNYQAKNIIVATGSSPQVWNMLKEVGHSIVEPVPSLFTFNIKSDLLSSLPGLSVKKGRVKVNGSKLSETGPVLITHWGLSGPGILKLSSWGARELAEKNYNFTITVNWSEYSSQEVEKEFLNMKTESPNKQITNTSLFNIPSRLWKALVEYSGITTKTWSNISKNELNKLVVNISQCEFNVNGKSTFKDEFVTSGGVKLKEVNFKTMESKVQSNLYFTGEVLNIDALTGGFNFQAAWTTAWIVGSSVVI
jgi:predicted Rossmann fold flavoprotein